MNKQGPGGIGWTDYTWNPIKGPCPVGCWYCYGRRLYARFPKGWPDPEFFPYMDGSLDEPERIPAAVPPKKIFICSTFEIFHPVTLTDCRVCCCSWRDMIFQVIEANPGHTFQILTKLPEKIDRPMPDNVWLGVSITHTRHLPRLLDLGQADARIKFISFEPMLERPIFPRGFDWIILGRLTGHGRQHDPPREWIQEMVDAARKNGTPIFLKGNLQQIWGKDLIREFPNVNDQP